MFCKSPVKGQTSGEGALELSEGSGWGGGLSVWQKGTSVSGWLKGQKVSSMTIQLCLTPWSETLWKHSVNERSWGAAGRWVTQVGTIKPGTLIRLKAKNGKTILCQILKRDRKGPEGRQQLRQLWLRNQARGNETRVMGWAGKQGAKGVESSGSLSQASVSPCPIYQLLFWARLTT